MKKRLSFLLALFALIPTYTFGMKIEQGRAATKRIKEFLQDSYVDVQSAQDLKAFFEKDKKEAINDLRHLSPTMRTRYSREITQKEQQLFNTRQPRDVKHIRAEREERNRRNRERNRAQMTKTRISKNTKKKKKKKPKTLKEQVARWVIKQFTKHPLRTLMSLGVATAGGYQLWQMVKSFGGNNAQANQNQQVQCLLCEQQFAQNQTVRLDCDHTFCGNCLHEYIGQKETIFLRDNSAISLKKRYCPVRSCKKHLCGNLCTRATECTQEKCNSHNQLLCNRHKCTNHIQPLTRRILVARRNQIGRLNNQNGAQQGGLQNQPQQQQGGIISMLLQMLTMGAMKWIGF